MSPCLGRRHKGLVGPPRLPVRHRNAKPTAPAGLAVETRLSRSSLLASSPAASAGRHTLFPPSPRVGAAARRPNYVEEAAFSPADFWRKAIAFSAVAMRLFLWRQFSPTADLLCHATSA